MHGSGRSHRWVVHLMAGAALGAVAVLVVWIFSGGRPFGEVVGTSDVSSPTTAAVAKTAAAPPADPASRLASRPPALGGERAGGELRFRKPATAERKVAAKKPKRAARRKRARRVPVVRVVAPPAEQDEIEETPVAATPSPSPAPTAAPKPASPPPGGAGGGSAKPKSPGPTLWAGEG
jgi:hypothetical protein